MEYEQEHKLNYFEIKQKLKIPPEKRTVRDILKIKVYMDQSKIALNFKEEFTDKNTAEKLIYFCCIEMKYKHFKKGTEIMKIGDSPDYFYSIILGKVNILKPQPKIAVLTGFQYFEYLMNIRKEKDSYVFNLCIKNNIKNFCIEANDIEIIHYIYLLIYLEHLRSNPDPEIDLDKVLDLLDITPEELGIDPNLVTSNYYINDNLKKIIKKIPHITQDLIKKYSFIYDSLIKKEVTIYEYKIFLSLKANDYFGDSAIETNSHRNATIVAAEDTDIAYLPYILYSTQIATEKAIILQHKIIDLHHSSFFHNIKLVKFSKEYFCLFISEKYYKGDIVFSEGEEIKYLYFIEEGSVELSVNKSVNEIEKIIYLIEENKRNLKKNNYIDILLNKENEYKTIDANKTNLYDYSKIDATEDTIDKVLKEKNFNRIIILTNKEDIGIVSHFLGNKYLCTCKVISNNAKIYKIEIDYLYQILNNEKEIISDFCIRLKNKMELMNKMLFKINKVKLMMLEEKKNQNTLNVEEKEDNSINNINNKLLVDYEKISDLITQRKDCNYFNTKGNQASIKSKNKLLKLPKINSSKKILNFSFRSLNIKDKIIRQNKSTKLNVLTKNRIKYTGLQLLNLINQKQKLNSLEKSYTYEDIEIAKIQKELISFSKDKKNYLSHKFKLFFNRNKKELKKIKKNDSSEKSNERIENNFGDLFETNNYSSRKIQTKKVHSLLPFKSINAESSREIKNDNFRTLSNDYIRLKTEQNNIRINDNNEIIKEYNCSSNKRYDHPYYDPLTLVKKEKYMIFERGNINRNKLVDDYLDSNRKRIGELKKIRLRLRNNFAIKKLNNNYN